MKTIDEMRRETRLLVVVANHNGVIREVNDSSPPMFGWARGEIVGKPLVTIIPRGSVTCTTLVSRVSSTAAVRRFWVSRLSSRP